MLFSSGDYLYILTDSNNLRLFSLLGVESSFLDSAVTFVCFVIAKNWSTTIVLWSYFSSFMLLFLVW